MFKIPFLTELDSEFGEVFDYNNSKDNYTDPVFVLTRRMGINSSVQIVRQAVVNQILTAEEKYWQD